MPPEHGTLYASKAGCDCDPCQTANRDYQRRQRRLQAYGRWAPFVDAEPARLHVKSLQAVGIGIRRIADLSGLGPRTISHLIYGRPSDGFGPAQKLRPYTAAAILAVQPGLESYAPHAKVDATGTRRRIQALCVNGWSIPRQARELGLCASTVQRFLRTNGVEAVSAIAVRDLYDRLWDQSPPDLTKGDRIASSHARGNAKRHGWPPPLAWDDETIDDPKAKPDGVRNPGTASGMSTEEKRAAVASGTKSGLSAKEIGDLVGISQRSVVRHRAALAREATA